MRRGSIFLRSLTLPTGVLVISAALLGISAKPGLPAEEQESAIETVDILAKVIDENRGPVADILVHCEDMNGGHIVFTDALTDAEGKFVLSAIPTFVGTIKCSGGGSIYTPFEKLIPVGKNTTVVFSLQFQIIKQLTGWITTDKGWAIENARVRLTRSDGTSYSRLTAANGSVVFENLKPGPAQVEYSAKGLETLSVRRTLVEGSDLSTSLTFESFPSGLFLLIPGVLVLALWAGMDWRGGTSESSSRNLNAMLIFTSLVIWGGSFFFLWFMLREKSVDGLSIFHPALSFPLFVPFLGFLGALIFVIDALRTSRQNSENSREFAPRLVLGPYVAVVTVLFFRDKEDMALGT